MSSGKLIFSLLTLALLGYAVSGAPQWLSDSTTRGQMADDWGHAVHYLPSAVVRPQSDGDVRDIVLEARNSREQITVRGHGHSAVGQTQCCGCLVIDMSSMNQVREIGTNFIVIEAGAQWRVAFDALFPLGRTTPVQTDWPGLSVGGVISGGGGLGPGLFRSGRIVDYVLEVTVVTGKGDIIVASPTVKKELFDAVLNGLGQFGVITAVKLATVPIPGTRIRVYNVYSSITDVFTGYTSMYSDLANTPFNQLESFPVFNFPGTGAGLNPAYDGYYSGLPGLWVNIHEYGVFYNPGSEPNDGQLLSYFPHVAGSEQVRDMSYTDWIHRLDFVFGVLLPSAQFNYAWKNPHPWFEVVVPLNLASSFVTTVLSHTSPAEAGFGSVQSIIPLQQPTANNALQLLPQGQTLVYFGLLRQINIAEVAEIYPEVVRISAINSQLRMDAEQIGGKPVVTSTLPSSVDEWRMLLGDKYDDIFRLKGKYDPKSLFGNNYGILPYQHPPCEGNRVDGMWPGTF